jgi:alkaline phosphatase
MRKHFLLFITVLFIFANFSCTENNSSEQAKKEIPIVKNIIFLIGDGMGTTQVYSAMTRSKVPLNFERFKVSGFSKTFSLNNYITDSAAGGTALATGHRTGNGVIGQDTSGNQFTSILELAEKRNYATGFVVTSAVTHATPASFVAHVSKRSMFEDIAKDISNSGIDVFIGGGYNHFAKRKDKLNLIDSLKSKGYFVTQTFGEVMASETDLLAGFTASEHNPSMSEGRGEMLPKATQKAIDILSKSENGFFLMVEGSEIDFGCHANDLEYVIAETLDFDQAIGVALDFAEKDGHTLVVVTADHESGGLSIVEGDMESGEMEADFSTKHHSPVMVPVFAFGPGAEKFSGIIDNTDFKPYFEELYGFTE